MIPRLELHPGTGLGPVRFGMTLDEVVELVGAPDRSWQGERDDPDDDADETGGARIRVDAWRCEFWFLRDGRLHWIACMHPELEFRGRRLVGAPLDEVIGHLATELGELPEAPDAWECEDAWDRRFFEEHWIDVQAHFGTVDAIDFGHYFDADDQRVWPKP